MLYHELVELPEHPDVWYSLADSVHMHGWVAIGEFLFKCSISIDTSYGLDLVVLDSICDRLQLQRSTVHNFLIQFADPEKMAFSQIATLVNAANAKGQTELKALEDVQSKLLEFSKLTAHIKPTESTIYDGWHAMVMERLDAFIQVVIGPRIAHFCSGAPLITASTSEQLPKEAKDGIKLNYLYEVMQQKRPVPLSRYGIHYALPSTIGLATPPSSPPDAQGTPDPPLSNAEHARNHAIQLMIDNRDLRAQVVILEQELERLQQSNDKLARKVANLTRSGPTPTPTYTQDDRSSPAPSTNTDADNIFLQVPKTRTRPRSLSHDAGEKLAAELDQKLNPSHQNHTRYRSEVLSLEYEELFDALDSPPSPPIRLSDPATDELLQPRPPRQSQYGTGAGRRSGVIFSTDQKDLLGAIREGKMSPPLKDNGDEGEGTSTPYVRRG
jgi:hypothetical protein